IGGWLIEHVNWRAVFFLNVPLAAIVIFLAQRYIPESRDATRGSRVDWKGAGLAVLGPTPILFALLGWPQPGANRGLLGIMVASGVASLAGFVMVERRAPDPMVPLALFDSRTFTLANVLTLLLYSALMIVFWLMPLNLIQIQHYSATAASAALLP